MPKGWTVAVHDTFGVRLSTEVVCDGFLKDAHIRVQTHIHQDHRQGFDNCKGPGRKIVALPGTRDLMIAEADDLLARRDNFFPLEPGEEFLELSEAARVVDGRLRELECQGGFGMVVDETYPELEEIMEHLQKLSQAVYRIDATERALRLGAAILGNMIMVGALLQLNLIPLSVVEFCETLRENMPVKNLDINLEAIEEGRKAIAHTRLS